MSHFTVLVIGDEPEKQLAPYQENNMGDCPKKFLKFNDTEDEMLAEFEKNKRDMIETPEGKFICTYDDQFKKPKKNPKDFLESTEYVYPKGYKKKQVPFKTLHKTFDEFVKDYHGGQKRDSIKKRFGYWENPDRRWDWYQLGGRWTGFFKMKVNSDAVPSAGIGSKLGDPSLVCPQVPEGNTADQARKGDIDFQGMRDEAADKAGERYDRVARLLGGKVPKLTLDWKKLMDDKDAGTIDEKRKKYHAQPSLKAVHEAGQRKNLNDKDKSLLTWLQLEDYQGGREAYVGRAIRDAIGTHAVLKDGKWYERGEMGWWACVHDPKDGGRWADELRKLLDTVPDDTLLSVYDCHI